jgi:hypothetical protein
MLLTKSPVRFAKVALDVAREVLPRYRTKFSRQDFEWPQLVACLLVRLFFRLDLRGTEQLLSEFDALRAALELERVPDHTALCRALGHLSLRELARLLDLTVARLPRLRRRRGRPLKRETVITDSTGMRQEQASQHYRRRKKLRVRRWPKWSVACDRKRHVILSQVASRGPSSDHREFKRLVSGAQRRRPSQELLADAGYDSAPNLRWCREACGLRPIIRIKAGRPPKDNRRMASAERRRLKERFPKKRYGQRWQVESLFSAHKRRFGEVLRSRSRGRRHRELLLRGILHNLAVLLPRSFLRIATEHLHLLSLRAGG